jgi:propanol-preferring alcohol dehydrogenase
MPYRVAMRALQLTAWGKPPELREVPVPQPGPGEVLVRVAGAGACHSDLHLLEAPDGVIPYAVPFTLGHENTGWVAALGAGVTPVDGLRDGDPVAVYGPWGCGWCRACRTSAENLCEHAAPGDGIGGGIGFDGGMAEYMLVPSSRLLVPLGDLDPVDAAPLGDAALTPYHAIATSRAALVPGSTAVVIGAGGLGHMAIQILRALTPARVIAIDRDEHKLSFASDIGADSAINAADDAAAQVNAATRGLGAELVVDLVGADDTLALGVQCLRPGGDLAIVGLAGGTLPVSFFGLPSDARVRTSFWGTLVELTEILDLARAGKIRAHVERFSLDDAALAYERLAAGTVTGRAVVVP